jgi:hypothetical protein
MFREYVFWRPEYRRTQMVVSCVQSRRDRSKPLFQIHMRLQSPGDRSNPLDVRVLYDRSNPLDVRVLYDRSKPLDVRVLYARIMIEQGADRFKSGTNDIGLSAPCSTMIYHLESGDRITLQFWLHVAREKDPKSNSTPQEVTCKLGLGGLKARARGLERAHSETGRL